MSQDDGVPVGKVENIPLPLKNWDEKGGAEGVGVEKSSQFDSPLT